MAVPDAPYWKLILEPFTCLSVSNVVYDRGIGAPLSAVRQALREREHERR